MPEISNNPSPMDQQFLQGSLQGEAGVGNAQNAQATGPVASNVLSKDGMSQASQGDGTALSKDVPDNTPNHPTLETPSKSAPFSMPSGAGGGGNPFFGPCMFVAIQKADTKQVDTNMDTEQASIHGALAAKQGSLNAMTSETEAIMNQAEVEKRTLDASAAFKAVGGTLQLGGGLYAGKEAFSNMGKADEMVKSQKLQLSADSAKTEGKMHTLTEDISMKSKKLKDSEAELSGLQQQQATLQSNAERKASSSQEQEQEKTIELSGHRRSQKDDLEEDEEVQISVTKQDDQGQQAAALKDQIKAKEAEINKLRADLGKDHDQMNYLEKKQESLKSQSDTSVLNKAKMAGEMAQGSPTSIIVQATTGAAQQGLDSIDNIVQGQGKVDAADQEIAKTQASTYEQWLTKASDSFFSDANSQQQFIMDTFQGLSSISSQEANFFKG